MSGQILAIGCVAFFCSASGLVRAQDFEIDSTFYRGGPKGNPKGVACPRMTTKSGQEDSVFIGGKIATGGRVFTVGREVSVTATAARDGRIQVDATFALAEVIGPNNSPQACETRATTSAILQPGTALKIEVDGGAEEKHWVEITVRKAKR